MGGYLCTSCVNASEKYSILSDWWRCLNTWRTLSVHLWSTFLLSSSPGVSTMGFWEFSAVHICPRCPSLEKLTPRESRHPQPQNFSCLSLSGFLLLWNTQTYSSSSVSSSQSSSLPDTAQKRLAENFGRWRLMENRFQHFDHETPKCLKKCPKMYMWYWCSFKCVPRT